MCTWKNFSGGIAPGPPEEGEGRGRGGKGGREGAQREGEGRKGREGKEGKGIRVGKEGIGPPQCLTQIDAPDSQMQQFVVFPTPLPFAMSVLHYSTKETQSNICFSKFPSTI
jgi:hypothetical protein